jgi:L-arabinose isomerase
MKSIKDYEVWFVTGSQHLYGEETLKQVADNAEKICDALNQSNKLPLKIRFKSVVTNPDAIYKLALEANSSSNCAGLITWMHTFSPSKMWIAGLKSLNKPLAHLHTQFNKELPWSTIDMDFMNLNQSAHGDREYGFITSRMRLNRKIIVGHWQDEEVLDSLNTWLRATAAWHDMQGMKIARFGDNMREVAVTEGDKVTAQIQFGYSVYGYGVGDLVASVNRVSDAEIDALIREYEESYSVGSQIKQDDKLYSSIKEAARIEVGLKNFLLEGEFKAFTTNFEDLHGMRQLPGLAVQRLMQQGYGFGAEGDWKTAALVRSIKVMSEGLKGGSSFMEDYTYHLDPNDMKVLGAHMLEVCPSVARGVPTLEIHPLSIGGKADPARLIFDVGAGEALNASIMDMGNRFRMVVNKVDVVEAESLPNLPVARVVWRPRPNLKVAAAGWIMAGGAHHTCFSSSIGVEHLEDFTDMCDIELVCIDEKTSLSDLKKELRWNEVYYLLNKGLKL